MEEGNTGRRVSRRKILNLGSIGAVAGLAGCTVRIQDYEVGVFEIDDTDDEGGESDVGGADDDDDASSEYPEASFDEDCIEHDPQNVEVVRDGDNWVVVDGEMRMLSFDEFDDAKRARQLIQAYEFDSNCFVGRPNAPMRYWLVGGGPASADDADVENEDCIEFDRSNLSIEQAEDGTWRVADGGSWLLSFESESNAERALDVIEHYAFDSICFVGRPNPPMQYWLSDGE